MREVVKNVEEQRREVPIGYIYPPRFEAGSTESAAFFEEEGFAVIAEALNGQEVVHALRLMWDYLEELGTGIRRDDSATWGDERWPTTGSGGIIAGNGIGQSKVQWFIRSVPRVKDAFAALWGTSDLLVSFDGMAVWRPWHKDPSGKTNQGASWLHVDQNPTSRQNFQCAQGFVNLLPMDSSTGGNVLIRRSHRELFAKIPQLYPKHVAAQEAARPGMDHFRFPPNAAGIHSLAMCHLEPGDLLLWDSRTAHCSSANLGTPVQDAPAELLRAVSFVCMMPRELTPADVLDSRKAAVTRLQSSTHWTDRWMSTDKHPKLVAARERDAARGFRTIASPDLDTQQLKLVGYTDEELAHRVVGSKL